MSAAADAGRPDEVEVAMARAIFAIPDDEPVSRPSILAARRALAHVATLTTALAEARTVLRQVEFDPAGVCPSCSKFEGHHSNCALAATLNHQGSEP